MSDWKRTKKGKVVLAAAEGGDTRAMRTVAMKCLRIDGDHVAAQSWLEKAAADGDAEAMTDLALLLETQTGCDQLAGQYWQQACEAGCQRALHILGTRAFESGDAGRVRELWTRAADIGHVGSMHDLAVLAERENRNADAQRWFARAADLGDRDSAFRLGLIEFARGNLDEAVRRFDQASTLVVHAAARCHRGLIREIRGDVEGAQEDLREAMDMGFDLAALRFAMVESSIGATPEAREMFIRAVQLGDRDGDPVRAQQDMYLGVIPQAEDWARGPKQEGNAAAQLYLGFLARHRGNRIEAREHFSMAISLGDLLAYEELAELDLQDGDESSAREWLRRAARSRNLFALLRLATLAEGTDEDLLKECLGLAEEVFSRASADGDAMSTFLIARLMLANGQFEQGRTKLEEAFRQGHPSAAMTLADLAAEDDDSAAEQGWLRQAAELGSPMAWLRLAATALARDDLSGAEDMLTPLVEDGNWQAMVLLADVYGRGGFATDAEALYEQARDYSRADSLVAEGNAAHDRGDAEAAFNFWTGAAERGHIPCMVTVGDEFLDRGDLDEAKRWFLRAALAGNDDAIATLESLS